MRIGAAEAIPEPAPRRRPKGARLPHIAVARAGTGVYGVHMTPAARTTWIFAVTGTGLFMAVLDNLVVTNALPSIRRSLGSSIENLEWAVNAYTLAFAVLLLTAAALGDRFGAAASTPSAWRSSPWPPPPPPCRPTSRR